MVVRFAPPRPSTLAERRLLLSLGAPALHVPRAENPYRVARRIEHVAKARSPDWELFRSIARRAIHRDLPGPGGDTPLPPDWPLHPGREAWRPGGFAT